MQTTLLSLHRAQTLHRSRNIDLGSRRSVGVLYHKPAPRESNKDASQPLPPAESRMWETAQHQLERGELNPLQAPGVSWRTLSYKAHIEKTKKKVGTRNNIIHKLRTSKWGATPTTLRSSALALCYSAAEYACPVWERSTYAKKLDATLNETCRMITGCLKPTNTNSLPVLAGIAPSDIRRAVASRTERTRQTTDQRHPLNGHLGVVPRLKLRKSFIKCTEPINTMAKAARMAL